MRPSGYKFQSPIVKFFWLTVLSIVALMITINANAQNQTSKNRLTKAHPEAQQPLYKEYRGVRLNMTMEEARAKLGAPVLKSDELDYFVFSENETAQIAYNSAHRVVTISVDYMGGIGAPDYMMVVGTSLLQRADGSLYRMVENNAEGSWVSYNKSSGTVPTVTITLQLFPK